jgi:hypothetical protein
MSLEFLTTAPRSASATITIVNAETLKSVTKQRFGGRLPELISSYDPERLRGSLTSGDTVWGLTQTASDTSQAMSSAAVLAGSEIWFYIAPQGHPAAYLEGASDSTVFMESTLNVSIYDALRNQILTAQFRDFRSASDDPGRYLKWTVPEPDRASNLLYDQEGFHGVFVMTIRESYRLYNNAEWTEELDLPMGMDVPASTSTVYMKSYWWKNILHDVTSVGNYRNTAILENTSMLTSVPSPSTMGDAADVYDNYTKFPLYEPAGITNSVSDDEKTVIIMDYVYALLSSQIPLMTSDSPIVPLLPIGMTTGTEGEASSVTAARTNAAIEPSPYPLSRTFSLTGIPPAYNLHSDLKLLTSDRNQTTAVLKDPPKFMMASEEGTGQEGRGNSGLGFCLRGVSVSSVHSPRDLKTSDAVSISLGEDSPTIGTITIRQQHNLITVTISDITSEDLINTLSFKVSENDNNYAYYFDRTGTVRSHSFYLPDFGDHLGPDSIINVEVGVEDDVGTMRFFNQSAYLSVQELGKPSVYNIRCRQLRDGSGKVEVLYDCIDLEELGTFTVYFSVSDDGGITWTLISTASAKGDVGSGVLCGSDRKIIWDPEEDEVESGNYYRARVVAAGESGIAEGDSVSGTFAIRTRPATAKAVFGSGSNITLSPEATVFGVDSGEDIKSPELTVENIRPVYLISSSSSTEVTSGTTSESSYSFDETSQTTSANSTSSSVSSLSTLSSLSSISSSSDISSRSQSSQSDLSSSYIAHLRFQNLAHHL